MKITIITVVLNNKAHIDDCIKSVISQRYRNIEYIVIDGGSTDGTIDIIRKYEKNISYWVSESDYGIYDAMNKGIKLATGDIIGFLNSDDFYAHSYVLDKVIEIMTNLSLDACYADLVYVNKYDTNSIVRYWRSCSYQKGLFETGWAPPHPTFFARRLVYETYGNFDLRYNLAADFDLLVRLLERHMISSFHIPEVIIKMRTGGATNKSLSNIIKQNNEIFKSCREHGIKISTAFFILSKLKTRISQFRQGCS